MLFYPRINDRPTGRADQAALREARRTLAGTEFMAEELGAQLTVLGPLRVGQAP